MRAALIISEFRTAIAAAIVAVCLGLTAPNAAAQEESVKPGINAQFKDPDVEAFIGRFETESREIYRHRYSIVETLGLKPGMNVADVGAGTGFFSILMASRVGGEGKIYAVDIAKNFIDHIAKVCKEQSIANVEPILCTERSSELPENSVDLVFICDTYHHFEYPHETMASIAKAVRPGGRVVVVDFERVKGVTDDFSITHVRCGKGTVTDEIKDSGFDLDTEIPMMKNQYILRFVKRTAKTQ